MDHSDAYYMYYLAILCPPSLDKKILVYKHWMRDQFGCTAALKSPAHITLIPPCWISRNREPALLHLLDQFETKSSPGEIYLSGFSAFSKNVLFVSVLHNPSLIEIRNNFIAHFRKEFTKEISADEKAFHPHITIATRDMKPAQFDKAREYFSGISFEESFIPLSVSIMKLLNGSWYQIAEKLL